MAGSKAGPPASRMVAINSAFASAWAARTSSSGVIGAPEQFGFMRPMRAEPVKQPGERRMGPTRRMHAVGDRPDRIAGEHAGGGLLMALRNAIDIAAEVEREAGHIERIVAGETSQRREIDKIPEQAADQIVTEPVMARIDRSMGREHAALAAPAAGRRGTCLRGWRPPEDNGAGGPAGAAPHGPH